MSCRAVHRRIGCGYHFCINAAALACPICKRGTMIEMGWMKSDGRLLVGKDETSET